MNFERETKNKPAQKTFPKKIEHAESNSAKKKKTTRNIQTKMRCSAQSAVKIDISRKIVHVVWFHMGVRRRVVGHMLCMLLNRSVDNKSYSATSLTLWICHS